MQNFTRMGVRHNDAKVFLFSNISNVPPHKESTVRSVYKFSNGWLLMQLTLTYVLQEFCTQ